MSVLVRALVCDDHPMCREAFAIAIGIASPGATVLHAGSLAEAETHIQAQPEFALVIADLMLPDSSGFASLLLFRRLLPNTPIAITSSAHNPDIVARAARLGAVGFLAKSVPMGELVADIGTLLTGGRLLADASPPPGVDGKGDEPLERLTPAQLKMVLAAARGQLNKQIAFDNGVSEATVKAHLAAAFKKLDVTNRVQAGLLIQSLSLDDPRID